MENGVGVKMSGVARGQKNTSAPCTILVIDDDDDQCAYLEAILSTDGFDVRAAYSSRAALSVLRETKIDLVICDFEMPGASGLEFIEYIRTHNLTSAARIPVILLTGTMMDIEQAARDLGADSFCSKRSGPENLLMEIKKLRPITGERKPI